MTRVVTSAVAILVTGVFAWAADKPDPKSPLGKVAWDTRAFNLLFKVVETTYDAETNQVRWTLETKDAYRSVDFVREIDKDKPFVLGFVAADGEEVATVRLALSDFKGIPKDKVIPKGTQLQVGVELPKAFDKTKAVVIRRGKE